MNTRTMRELEARAGTGFMMSLSEAMHDLHEKGYVENFVLNGDVLEARDGEIRVNARDFVVDSVERFEESSDAADQSILYAISVPSKNLKGLVVETYGTYSDDVGAGVLARLREYLH